MRKSNFLLLHAMVFLNRFMASLVMGMTNITSDQSALLALKAHITDDPQNFLTSNWSTATSVCNWIGVTCSGRHCRVRALDLTHMRLAGTLPPEIGNLSFLGWLRLGNNSFHGALPQESANLRRLQVISFSWNNFGGEIPSWFASFHELRRLFLNRNYFTGSVPTSLCHMPQLETLDLSANNLQGHVPGVIGNFPNLKELYLDRNNLSGSVPATIYNITTLEVLDLSQNRLSGSLPSVALNVSSLKIIDFTINNLSGRLPQGMFSHFPNLEAVYLTWNQFSGKIPSTLFQCKKLQNLSISNNHFEGSISPQIGNLTLLKMLFLGLNNFEGDIPQQIGNLNSLEILSLTRNRLAGSIPAVIGNLTQLKLLDLSFNNLTGEIPEKVAGLQKLEILHFAMNSITGHIPPGIFNGSRVQIIGLAANYLSGPLPSSTGLWLPSLEHLLLGGNELNGLIPSSLGNASQLAVLDLTANILSGSIPETLSNLRNLKRLRLGENILTSKYSELSFITSLTSCRQLTELNFDGNQMNGSLPASLVNLSTSLQVFSAPQCNIRGSIPGDIGNLVSLAELDLASNELTGSIPSSLGKLHELQLLSLENNRLQGSFPPNLCQLESLGYLSFKGNSLFGSIPECFGNLTSLRRLDLSFNAFVSAIPFTFWSLQDLLQLNLSSNYLSGSLPLDIANLKVVTEMDLSRNNLTGGIPSSIVDLIDLAYLSLSSNRLQGLIPSTIGNLLSLEFLDLSNNSLSGAVPKSLENLLYLKYFNVSFNELQGEIPTRGPFANFTGRSFMGNADLCGPPETQLQPCNARTSRRLKSARKLVLKCVLPAAVAIAMLVLLLIIFIIRRNKKKVKSPSEEDLPELATWRRITYRELEQATDGFREDNLLGKGSFGSVYKGTLSNALIIAVKVLNLQLEGAFKTFETECEVQRNIQHRNLTKIISICSNMDFKALVLRYMPNGNLDKWLYSENYHLDILQRLNIMIDVASALEYLHHGSATPVVHCDLKPSNVLLDEDMVAHLTDFGISNLLGEGEIVTQTMTLATIGYMAPEYGSEGMVSTKGDVYSFGILLLETFTKRKPTHETFAGEMSLKSWVKECLSGAVGEVMDPDLLASQEEQSTAKRDCILSILGLALKCCAESPLQRMNMNDVAASLNQIKRQLLTDVGSA